MKSAALYLALVMALGCGGDPATPTGDRTAPKANAPATLSIAGVQSVYAAGEKVKITVKAFGTASGPVAKLSIAFAPSAGGSVDPATATTDANGVATTTWSVPITVGTATLLASSGATTLPVATEIRAAVAARINKLGGDAQDGIEDEPLPNALRVSVTDVYGNAIPGRAVAFVVTAGGGSVAVSSATTAADGSTSTEWRVGGGNAANTLEARTLDLPPAIFTARSQSPAGTFALTGSMLAERWGHTATLLRDGRVLVAGGLNSDDPFKGTGIATAELYDPATARFTPTANTMAIGRAGHSATLLADGRVLIAGGYGERKLLRGAELFDPSTNRFEPTGDLLDAQDFHEGTLLRSGEVLITGGFNYDQSSDTDTREARAELYNPATGLFRYTGPFADTIPVNADNGLIGIQSTLLGNGKVLIASLPQAQIYDPLTGTFAATGSMLTNTGLSHISDRTATLLVNGNVLLTGGRLRCSFSKAELYDPTTGMFRYTTSMRVPRDAHTATRLASGKVLIAGGESITYCDGTDSDLLSLASAVVYDVSGTAWAVAGPMKVSRKMHRATLLLDGRVLITGGLSYEGPLHSGRPITILKSAELFTERR